MGENRLIFGADLSRYYSDSLCDGPTLSASIAHKLIAESCAHAFEAHPKLGGKADGDDEEIEDEDETPADKSRRKTLDGGTVTHALVLGRGVERLEVIGADKLSKDGKMTTKAAKDAKAAAQASGKIAIAEPKMARYRTAAEAIRAELARREIEIDPHCTEVVLLWVEVADDPDVKGIEVQCRGLLDHVALGAISYIDDLKTGHTAHPRRLARKVYDFGAHIQAAAYTSGLAKVRPELAGFTKYRWLFAETRKPFPMTIAQPNGELRELGARQWRRAVNAWARCFKNERWPGYTDAHVIVDIEPPPGAMERDLEAAIGVSFSPEGLEYDE